MRYLADNRRCPSIRCPRGGTVDLAWRARPVLVRRSRSLPTGTALPTPRRPATGPPCLRCCAPIPTSASTGGVLGARNGSPSSTKQRGTARPRRWCRSCWGRSPCGRYATAKGRTPQDVAAERGHVGALIEMLAPPTCPLDDRRVAILDQRLGDVIDGRIRVGQLGSGYAGGELRSALRYPPIGIKTSLPSSEVPSL